jgi:molecular chaperone DnaJ
MTAAALGTGIELETLDGVEQVEVRPGTQPGAVLTLRARGVPHLRGSGRGDLHIQLDVRTPTRLDAEQEGFLRSLARSRGEEGVTLRATEQVADETGGFFSRLRGAFSGR